MEAAKKNQDLATLQKLCNEAKKEGIKVKPSVMVALHHLQASAPPKPVPKEADEEASVGTLPSLSARPKSESQTTSAAQTRKIYFEKKQQDVNLAVMRAEDDPHPKNVDFARK